MTISDFTPACAARQEMAVIEVGEVVLRALELKDVDALYKFKNDCDIIQLLGGFSAGFSRQNLAEWIGFHKNRADEVLWAIADKASDTCLGHTGLYKIDNRVRKAEFAVTLGDKERWGQGLGRRATQAVLDFGFGQLNLHKISLFVLANNQRAIHLYETLGFRKDGVLRDEQFRNGKYIDMLMMSLLEEEWPAVQSGKSE